MMSIKNTHKYLTAAMNETLLAYTKNSMTMETNQHLKNTHLPDKEACEGMLISAWEEFLRNKKKLRYIHYYKLWFTRHRESSKLQIVKIVKGIIATRIAQLNRYTGNVNELSPKDKTTLATLETQWQNKGLKKQEISFLQHHLAGVFTNCRTHELVTQWNHRQKKSLSVAKYEKIRRRIIRKMQRRAGASTNWFSTI